MYGMFYAIHVLSAIEGYKQGGVQLPGDGWRKVRSWLLETGKRHYSPGAGYMIAMSYQSEHCSKKCN